tara:strand:- start:587 stop:787 length:201 start_codon:yes stop_codon:yes gene_type:complete
MKSKTLLKDKNTKVASDDLFLKIQERLKQIQDELKNKNLSDKRRMNLEDIQEELLDISRNRGSFRI